MRVHGTSAITEIEPTPADTGHARLAAITNAQIKLHEAAALLRAAGLRAMPLRVDAIALEQA